MALWPVRQTWTIILGSQDPLLISLGFLFVGAALLLVLESI